MAKRTELTKYKRRRETEMRLMQHQRGTEPRSRRMKTKNNYSTKDRTSHITISNTNSRKEEEIKAVIPACTKGCLDLNPRHHKVGPVQ